MEKFWLQRFAQGAEGGTEGAEAAPAEAPGTQEQPSLPERQEEQYTLPELELYCRKLDLYFSFAKAFGCPVDEDALYDAREAVAEEINEILLHRLKNNIRFCARCGAALPLRHHGRLCDGCYRAQNRASGGFRRQNRGR